MSEDSDQADPPNGFRGGCPRCGAAMEIVRITPKTGPMPELRTFQCSDCDYVMTIEVAV
jgi:transposase-like protein